MSSTASGVHVLKQWLAASSRASAPQYAKALRPLLAELDIEAIDVTRLVRFVLDQPSGPLQRKACTAATAFFGDLYESGTIASDPAHRLAGKVRLIEAAKERRAALVASGISERNIEGLLWADVLWKLAGLDHRPAHGLPDSDAVRALEEELLGRLGVSSREKFLRILAEPLA